MSADAYRALVEQRRADGFTDFVIDDEGLGYMDDGEEILGLEELRQMEERAKQRQGIIMISLHHSSLYHS